MAIGLASCTESLEEVFRSDLPDLQEIEAWHALEQVWKDVENVLIDHLSKISISELASRQGILNQQVKLS